MKNSKKCNPNSRMRRSPHRRRQATAHQVAYSRLQSMVRWQRQVLSCIKPAGPEGQAREVRYQDQPTHSCAVKLELALRLMHAVLEAEQQQQRAADACPSHLATGSFVPKIPDLCKVQMDKLEPAWTASLTRLRLKQ